MAAQGLPAVQPAHLNANIVPQGPEDHETVEKANEIAKDSLAKDQIPSQPTSDPEKFHLFFLDQLGESVAQETMKASSTVTSQLASESSKETLNQGNQFQSFFLHQLSAEEIVEKVEEMIKAPPTMPNQLSLEGLNDLLNQGLQFQKFSMSKYDSNPNKLYVDLLKFGTSSRRSIEKQLFVDVFNKYHGDEGIIYLALLEHFTDQKKLKDVDFHTAGDWFLDCAICLLEDDEFKQISPELQPDYQKVRDKAQKSTKERSVRLFNELTASSTKFSWGTSGRLSAELGWRKLPEMKNEVSEKCTYFFAATDKFTFIRVQATRKRKGGEEGDHGAKYFLLGTELFEKLLKLAPKKPDQ